MKQLTLVELAPIVAAGQLDPVPAILLVPAVTSQESEVGQKWPLSETRPMQGLFRCKEPEARTYFCQSATFCRRSIDTTSQAGSDS